MGWADGFDKREEINWWGRAMTAFNEGESRRVEE
jgi:hypothetical protein